MIPNLKNQNGAAAIFIVVFFAILISIIALSFMRIAVEDQQQATNNDLSQSAYDSADAGLEDAKRALSWYRVNCPANSPPLDVPNCAAYNTNFAAPKRCNLAELPAATLPGTQRVGATSEVKVSTTATTDEKLDQAYTCVTVTTRTKDYKGEATNGKSDTLIPLRTVDNDPIDTIELNWFSNRAQTPLNPSYPSYPDLPEPTQANWPSTTPPVVRFQLIPALRGNININDVDSDTKTVFLYPSSSGSDNINLYNNDIARTYEKNTAPSRAKCSPTVNPGRFACSVKITQLPLPTSGGNPTNTDYYLRLSTFYNNSDYQVRLFGDGGTNIRLFDNVEPEVDSTGRANDVFRRVQSRVRDLTSSNPLTDGGFDITKGVCKEFTVPVYSTACTPPELIEPVDPNP